LLMVATQCRVLQRDADGRRTRIATTEDEISWAGRAAATLTVYSFGSLRRRGLVQGQPASLRRVGGPARVGCPSGSPDSLAQFRSLCATTGEPRRGTRGVDHASLSLRHAGLRDAAAVSPSHFTIVHSSRSRAVASSQRPTAFGDIRGLHLSPPHSRSVMRPRRWSAAP